MGERYIDVEGRRIRAGLTEDAAKLWTSTRKPNGIDPGLYRNYVTRAKIAPGPILVDDPADPGNKVPLVDGATRGYLYDLDEVVRVNVARQGQGRRPSRDSPETLRHTALRQDVLVAARDGKLRIVPETGRTERRGELVDRRAAQAVTELRRLGMLTDPTHPAAAGTGLVEITDAGTAALVRWGLGGKTAPP